MKLPRIAILVSLAIGLVGCLKKAKSDANIKHAEAKAGTAGDSSYWAKITPEESQRYLGIMKEIVTPCGFDSEGSVLTNNLQQLMDTLFDMAQQTAASSGRSNFLAPRPKIVVAKDERWNAAASSYFFRFPLIVDYRTPPGKFRDPETQKNLQSLWESGYFDDGGIKTSGYGAGYQESYLRSKFTLPGNPLEFDAIARRENFLLKQEHSKCQLTSWENGIGVISPTCETTVMGKWFDTDQMMPIIVVNAGLLSTTSLSATVAVLAHELGHYLYAHGILRPLKWNPFVDSPEKHWTKTNGYLFYEDDYLKGGKPKPIKNNELREEARTAIFKVVDESVPPRKPNEPYLRDELLRIVQSKISPAQFGSPEEFQKLIRPEDAQSGEVYLISLLEFQCRHVATAEICDNFSKVANNLQKIQTTDGNPEVFTAFYDALGKFATKLAVTLPKNATSNQDSCLEKLTSDPTICLDTLLTELDQYFYFYGGVNLARQVATEKLQAKAHPNLADWLTQMFIETDTVYATNLVAAKYLNDNHLGWYSSEQEADDFSVEMLAGLGYDPAIAPNIWTDAAVNDETLANDPTFFEDHGYPLPVSCRDLMTKGFRDSSGKWLPVRQMDWVEVHHQNCYRAFNLTREISLHNYDKNKKVTAKALLDLSDNWTAVQSAAQLLVNETKVCKGIDATPQTDRAHAK